MKSKQTTKKEERATFRLPRELKERIEACAQKQDRSVSWVVEHCVEMAIKDFEQGSFAYPDRQPDQELMAA
jgi:predicted DNA-binding protein